MNEGGNRIARQLNVSVPRTAAGAAVRSASWGSAGRGAAVANDQVSWVRMADSAAAELQRRAADLEATARTASGRQYQAKSVDARITVTVDGRMRLTGVRLGDGAADSGAGVLARALADTVNSALEEARHCTQALLGGADPALQAWLSDVQVAGHAEAAASMISATSADGSVTATVTRAATIVAIEVPGDASGQYAQARLGDAVAEAVNAALAAAEQAGQESLGARAPAPDPWSAGKASLDALTSRMDLLIGALDRIGSSLGG
jgi:DNA-binding protein YbaB